MITKSIKLTVEVVKMMTTTTKTTTTTTAAAAAAIVTATKITAETTTAETLARKVMRLTKNSNKTLRKFYTLHLLHILQL